MLDWLKDLLGEFLPGIDLSNAWVLLLIVVLACLGIFNGE